jgi:hypothetical protein
VFPYLKGFILIKCGFILYCSWIYCVMILFPYLRHLTFGIRALSWAKKKGIFFSFCRFSKKSKKEGHELRSIYVTFGIEFSKTSCRYEFLLEKKAISKKKNHLNQSSRGQDITDLKSTIFHIVSISMPLDREFSWVSFGLLYMVLVQWICRALQPMKTFLSDAHMA